MNFDASLFTNLYEFFQKIFVPQFCPKLFFTISLKLAFKNILNERNENLG